MKSVIREADDACHHRDHHLSPHEAGDAGHHGVEVYLRGWDRAELGNGAEGGDARNFRLILGLFLLFEAVVLFARVGFCEGNNRLVQGGALLLEGLDVVLDFGHNASAERVVPVLELLCLDVEKLAGIMVPPSFSHDEDEALSG